MGKGVQPNSLPPPALVLLLQKLENILVLLIVLASPALGIILHHGLEG